MLTDFFNFTWPNNVVVYLLVEGHDLAMHMPLLGIDSKNDFLPVKKVPINSENIKLKL